MATPDIDEARLQAVESQVNYQFSDRYILAEALRAAGSVSLPPPYSYDNKSLALVGGAVMNMILTLHGHEKRASRGTINNVVTRRAGNSHVYGRGFHHGLDQYIQRNPSQGRFISDGLMASTVQAIVGAVYIDSDYNNFAVERAMETLGLFWTED